MDPATCPIVPGQEMTIEISKGRSGLGLSIVGGKDTPLVSFISVKIMFSADKDKANTEKNGALNTYIALINC